MHAGERKHLVYMVKFFCSLNFYLKFDVTIYETPEQHSIIENLSNVLRKFANKTANTVYSLHLQQQLLYFL